LGVLILTWSSALWATTLFPIKPLFDGHWEIDFSRSESPGDKLRYLYEVTLSGHRRRLAQSDPRFGDSPMMAMADLQGLINLGRLAEQITRTSVLEVVSSEASLEIHRDDNFTLRCESLQPESGMTNLGFTRCEWREEQLIVKQLLPGGIGIEHRLTLSPAGRELNVATSILGQGVSQAFTINRVYVPFEPGEDRFQCEYVVAKVRFVRLARKVPHEAAITV
jgi:hypothetical protein